MKKIAIILSGCGNRDGSELQETLSLFLAIDRRNWTYDCFAPEGYFEVVPHVELPDDDEEEDGNIVDTEQRDILVESARVCRGAIKSLNDYTPDGYDALLLPGGMGAARNLSTYAYEGPRMIVVDSVSDAILSTYRAHKPIGAMCIAPMVLAQVLGRQNITVTLGGENQAASIARQLGCRTEEHSATEACVDSEHKIITSPAYMIGTRISEIFAGGEALVTELEKMLG